MLDFKIWLVRIRFSPWKSNCLLLLQNSHLLFWNIHLFTHNANGSDLSSLVLLYYLFLYFSATQVLCLSYPQQGWADADLQPVGWKCWDTKKRVGVCGAALWSSWQLFFCFSVDASGSYNRNNLLGWHVPSNKHATNTIISHVWIFVNISCRLFFINPPLEDVLPRSVSH